MTCTSVSPSTPATTFTLLVLPPAPSTVTVLLAPVPVIAEVGTYSALSASAVVTWTLAERPVRRLLVSLVIASSAAYCTALEEPEEELLTGSELIDSTLALRLEPASAFRLTVADCPACSLSASASEKSAVTSIPVGLVITTKPEGVPEEEEEEEEADDPPLEPPEPPEPELPPEAVPELLPEPVLEPLPETVWPTFPATEATVPLTGAVISVPSTARCAAATAFCAEVTCSSALARSTGFTVGVALAVTSST